MTFFYDLNKKLKEVLDTPKSEHKQLNERDEGKHNNATTGFKALADKAAKEYGSKAAGERVAGAVRAKMAKAGKLEETDMDESALQAYLGKKKYGEQGMKALQKAGRDGASKKTMDKIRDQHDKMDEGMLDSLKAGMTKAAKVAKKAGSKALDTLGHGSDEAMRKDLQKKMGVPQTGKKPTDEDYGPLESADGALKGGQKKLDRNHNGKLDAQDFAMLRAGQKRQETDEGSDWSQLGKEYSRPKIGSVERGAKHDIEHTATGRRVTRRVDDQGMSVGADDEVGTEPIKRGRGRPKGSTGKLGAKGPSGTSKLMKREGEQELDEKAVSKKQQKFMGMVHAAQKGKKAASPEVAKVAKTMKKKDAEDFAATKHKGLPEKVKSNKKEKTEESDAAPASGKGVQFGKGIYDSLNREIENLIAESMSINASDSTEGGKSLTITATDDDAVKLAEIVRNSGIGGEMNSHEHSEEPCETCGSEDCGCSDIEEAVSENEPNWPTDEETNDDALQYSGGLNGPKSTGQTTVPVIANQGERTGVDDEELRRMMEMAGLQSELKPWERTMKEEAEDWTVDINKQTPQTPQFSLSRYIEDPVLKQYGPHNAIKGLLDNYADETKLADLVKRFTLPAERDREFQRMKNLINYYKQRNAASMAAFSARQDAEKAQQAQQQQQQQANTMATAKKGISGMYEEEELDEAKEMCEVCEATPCKCDESIEESLARFRSLAGLKEAAKPDFADIDKDGDKEEPMKKAAADKEKEDKKVEESIFKMTNLWKSYKG